MVRIAYLLFASIISLILLVYLSLPNFEFPQPPPGAHQSREGGDTETPLRRAYFTDMTREEVMNWYKQEFQRSSFLSFPLPTYRLNYPPEEAQTLIRDQARSTFLEEIVHPFRESIYINGFEPKQSKDAINIEGVHYRQKITVRFVPSSLPVRLVTTMLGLVLTFILVREIAVAFRKITNL